MKFILIFLLFLSSNLFGQDTLMSTQFEMNGCIRLYSSDSPVVIRNRKSLDSLVLKDANYEYCQEFLKELNMDNSSILGINLNSGYCRIPAGLTFDVVEMSEEKKCFVLISYTKPLMTCRARSSYDLWIKVPSIPEGFELEFTVTPLPYQE